jgi:hypothetical protein
MRRLDRALRDLAETGWAAGPERLIERLRRRLAGESTSVVIPGAFATRRDAAQPKRPRGLLIAAGAAAAALLVATPLWLLGREDGSPPVTTVDTTVAAEAWDLLVISDSLLSGGVAAGYAARIEQDLGVTVRVHDLWTADLTARDVLDKLRGKDGGSLTSAGSGRQNLLELIPEAEVIVVIGNPDESATADNPWDWDCPAGLQEDPACEQVNGVCGPETWTQYEADLRAIFEEVFALRGGEPVVLRTADWYLPWGPLENWRACGCEEVCKGCWAEFSAAIHRAAAARGVPVAGLLEAFSGPDLAWDMPREYMSSLGPSTEGAAAIADVLAALGYDPVGP